MQNKLTSRIGIILFALFKGLKLIGVFAKSAAFLSILSIFASTAFYSLSVGIWFAVGFILLLLIHELGHVYEIRNQGHGLKLPFFIPFMGAVVFMDKESHEMDRTEEAFIAYAGPFYGTIGALLAATPYLWTTNPFWLLLGTAGVVLNMFNMIPISPLDGGRITQAIDTRIFYLGIGLLIVAISKTHDMSLLFIAALVVSNRYKGKDGIKAVRIVGGILFVMVFIMGTQTVPLGFSDWLPLIFTIFILFGTNAAYDEYKASKTIDCNAVDKMDNRPPGPTSHRVAWAAAYIALLCTQGTALYFMIPLLRQN